jgi:hypothetical protein
MHRLWLGLTLALRRWRKYAVRPQICGAWEDHISMNLWHRSVPQVVYRAVMWGIKNGKTCEVVYNNR